MTEQIQPNAESFPNKNLTLTLDLAGLSAAQRDEGSILLGGSAAEYVTLEGNPDYRRVETVVFHWGDSRAEDVFANLFEHIEISSGNVLEFSPVAIVGNTAWLLTLQERDWNPELTFASKDHYVELPFTANHDTKELQDAFSQMGPWGKQVLGKVGSRYVRFSQGVDIGLRDGAEGAS